MLLNHNSPETRVFILVALARVNMSHPMTHVYTREHHENKNTRFWATYGKTSRKYSLAKFANLYTFILREEKVTIFATILAQKW